MEMKHNYRYAASLLSMICAGSIFQACEASLSESETEMRQEIPATLSSKIAGDAEGSFVDDELLLMVSEEAYHYWEVGDSVALADMVRTDLRLDYFRPALEVLPKNEKLARQLGLDRWFVSGFDAGTDAVSIATRLASSHSVEAVQFIKTGSCAPSGTVDKYAEDTRSNPYFTNDPLFHYQWNLYNDGSLDTYFSSGADVGATYAWNLCGGDPRVVVAIIDGPVKYDHEDLADNMWVNQKELQGTEGVDDDNNGYVDDIYGYNFAQGKGAIDWTGPGELGHGTHVAGIVGAVNDNGKGISSIAGGVRGKGNGIKLMSCQVFYGGTRSASDLQVGNAFIYAADNGASIAQCSYGYDGGTYKNDNAYINIWPFEYRGLKYFLDPSNSNCDAVESNVAVFAAGNESSSYSAYPGALPQCISVTALGPDGLPAAYTNYGLGCNIAAPGGDDNYGQTSKILSTGIPEINGDYAWMAGTSMACPHVSSVIALGMSYALQLGRHFTSDEFRAMVYASVNDIDSRLTGGIKTCPDGQTINLKSYYMRMGTGAVDAWQMLMQVEGVPSIIIESGKECRVSLEEYFGGGYGTLTYTGVDVDPVYESALGITSLSVNGGYLSIKCDKRGSGKVRVKAIAGGSYAGGPSGTGGTSIEREISILSRGISGWNNGWL